MTHFKQSRESRVSPLRQLIPPRKCIRVCPFFSMSPTHFHQLGTIKETRRNLHSKTLHFNLEEHYVVRQTSSSKHLTISSSQINGKQKRVSLHHTFIYIESQVTPKIFFRFTIRAGLTNPKLNLSLFLFVPILFPIISCQHSRNERMSGNGWI